MRKSETEMQFSADQKYALDLMEAGRNIFLTGGGGTGKSALVNAFIDRNPDKCIARLGTTGSASQLIGGQTMHSFFGLGTSIHKPFDLTVNSKIKRRVRSAKCLIIDEISMARIDHFQAVRDRLFACARGFGDFAGYQLIVVGDFAQLPPVVPDQERMVLDKLYGENRQYAFESEHWQYLERVELDTVHRQSGDIPYAEFLNKIRMGEEVDLDLVNQRIAPAPENSTVLVATNAAASRINNAAMEKLNNGYYRIPGVVKDNFNERNMRVPQELCLSKGSRVVICANNEKAGYANGSTGVLLECVRDLDKNPEAIVQLDNGDTVHVTQHTWDEVRYDRDENGVLKEVQIGSYTQLPLLPGWAITIHRSQGMSIENLHIDPRGSFAPGQAYVALSRGTRLEGITLEAPMLQEHIIRDDRVTDFMRGCKQKVAA
jgi:ATP-dependent exoDNAse (exonuclease V) alpha subunit